MQIIQSIQNRICEMRGERVLLDRDLAARYEVETRILNQAVKRNIKRFPAYFMFQLIREEFESIKFDIEGRQSNNSLASQFVILKTGKGQHSKYMPYAFTEQGVAMLSGVLTAIKLLPLTLLLCGHL